MRDIKMLPPKLINMCVNADDVHIHIYFCEFLPNLFSHEKCVNQNDFRLPVCMYVCVCMCVTVYINTSVDWL